MTPTHKPTRKPTRDIDIGKAALYAIIINGLQIAMLVVFVVYVLLDAPQGERSLDRIQVLAVVCAAMAAWGAAIDIRQGMLARRRARAMVDLEQTNTQMDALNHTLRAQRHDFLNHLQVVYSLMEMREYNEATNYLEKVYGEIRALSSVLRTGSAAVNALLQVKAAACQDMGIALEMDIQSRLEGLSMPSWELCRVLSNLLDNAMEAAKAAPQPRVVLTIGEHLRGFLLSVRNNGPAIPPEMRDRLFEPGVSTKGEGRGMGLAIVRQTLEDHGGEIDFTSDGARTVFQVKVPKAPGM